MTETITVEQAAEASDTPTESQPTPAETALNVLRFGYRLRKGSRIYCRLDTAQVDWNMCNKPALTRRAAFYVGTTLPKIVLDAEGKPERLESHGTEGAYCLDPIAIDNISKWVGDLLGLECDFFGATIPNEPGAAQVVVQSLGATMLQDPLAFEFWHLA